MRLKYGTKCLENLLLLINTQQYSLFQIATCCLWRQTPPSKDVFHPVSYTVDHSLSSMKANFKVHRLHMQIMRS